MTWNSDLTPLLELLEQCRSVLEQQLANWPPHLPAVVFVSLPEAVVQLHSLDSIRLVAPYVQAIGTPELRRFEELLRTGMDWEQALSCCEAEFGEQFLAVLRSYYSRGDKGWSFEDYVTVSHWAWGYVGEQRQVPLLLKRGQGQAHLIHLLDLEAWRAAS